MTPEFTPMDPALEEAVTGIREEALDPAVIEAAAARVWTRLSVAATSNGDSAVIRNCADFQALMPELRAGRLPEARAMLLRDHLHQCVACRRIYEGRVVAMPAASAVRTTSNTRFLAVAAGVLLVAGVGVWWAENNLGVRTGHAIVQSLDGTLFAVGPDGIRPLLKGQDLPNDTELRTAKDSDAVLQLADGSQVEMRERSSLYTTASASDITVHLGRGSVLVEATHRRTGHLYVDTADCRVAVTGTVFGVTAGMKGSRVMVLQGEVHVTQDNQEKILHAGDQTATNPNVEPEPLSEEISWSRNRDALQKQAPTSLDQLHLSNSLRYQSKLLAHLPASTRLYISIPNLAQYLADAESVLTKKMAGNPEMEAFFNGRIGHVLEMARAGSEYLGDEVDIIDGDGKAPVVVAEERRPGFDAFLRDKKVPLTVVQHGDMVLFGPERTSVEAASSQLDSGFQSKPLYTRIANSYRDGVGLLIWAEFPAGQTAIPGAKYFVAEQKQTGGKTVTSASLGFDGPRSGIAAQLAAPSAMASLDYVSPEALAVLAFVVKDPGTAVDAALSITQGSMAAGQKTLADDDRQKGFDIRKELAGSLGGEFTIAFDGSLMPVPSWKIIAEVYDQNRFQASLQRYVDVHNQDAATHPGQKMLKTAQETAEGHTFYTIALADSGPLLEAHYTFDRGFLVAGATRALVSQALKLETSATSIKTSSKFLEMIPRDHHVNFSAVIYQNLGDSLAPLAMLAGGLAGSQGGRGNDFIRNLTNIKPSLYAVYGEPDRITMAANGDVVQSTLSTLLSGNLRGLTGVPLPAGHSMGTSQR